MVVHPKGVALVQKFDNIERSIAAEQAAQNLRHSTDTVQETVQPAKPLITDERDRKFLDRFNAYVQSHIDDKDLNMDHLAEAMGYGRSKFYRKVTALIGCSPKEYIRKQRIERAAKLLRSSDTITVSEVAYMTGFNTPQYFSTVFRAYYNMLPSEYQKMGSVR